MAQPVWTGEKVRQTFIDFFVSKGHVHVPSSSVVPLSDPTLLFANSGMNQFKSIFLGSVDPKSDLGKLTRACNSQKCIRAGGKHNDLDDVGKDTYHHTFFEMLGNWSFGDYFKQEAIDWAWELLTEVYKLDKSRIYVTYFEGNKALGLQPDEDAKKMWSKYLPSERILPFGMKENFWEMGEVGPCGPCSEIHYDRIGGRNVADKVNKDDPDVIEIWNLVFMQFNREPDRSLTPLPRKHIDTGMGLERLTSILQDVRSNYDSDFFTFLFNAIEKATHPAHPYTGKLAEEDVGHVDTAYRVIADHLRTLSHAIADGAEPGAFGRNYVLRRIVRRAIRYGSEKLGAKDNFFWKLADVLIDERSKIWPELKVHGDRIKNLLKHEEELWNDTYKRGKLKLRRIVEASERKKKPIVPDDIVRLKSTFGFPPDLVLRILEEDYNIRISEADLKILDDLIEKLKDTAKETDNQVSYKLNVHSLDELKRKAVPATADVYKYQPEVDIEATVLALWDGKALKEKSSDERVGIILDRTNFYGQQGGQIYDTGEIQILSEGGHASVDVDQVHVCGSYFVHVGQVSDEIAVGSKVKLFVNKDRRRPVTSNHTATHMLNYALRQVLGNHTAQKGSDVLPDRFRFDFSHGAPLTEAELENIDKAVNAIVEQKLAVYSGEASLADAKKVKGLRLMEGEEYPNPVRIVSIGVPVADLLSNPNEDKWTNYSIEFCGGTHIKNSEEVKVFTIVGEEPLASGVRRIVALTGEEARDAINTAKGLEDAIQKLSQLDTAKIALKLPETLNELEKANIPASKKLNLRKKITQLQDQLKEEGKKAKAEQDAKAVKYGKDVVEALTKEPKPLHIGVLHLDSNNAALSLAAKTIVQGAPNTAVLLVSADKSKDSLSIVATVSKAVADKGLKANEWVQKSAAVAGGKGGGKPDTAQAVGKGVNNLDAVLAEAGKFAESKLK